MALRDVFAEWARLDSNQGSTDYEEATVASVGFGSIGEMPVSGTSAGSASRLVSVGFVAPTLPQLDTRN
jgi:hypothetical protein